MLGQVLGDLLHLTTLLGEKGSLFPSPGSTCKTLAVRARRQAQV